MILQWVARCEHCGRVVAIAPGRFNVTVAHASDSGQPCRGNEKRSWLVSLSHPAEPIARQHLVMQTDDMWELEDAC